MSPDPYSQFASPYIAMGNNPVMGVDPDGGFMNYSYGVVNGKEVQGFSKGATLYSLDQWSMMLSLPPSGYRWASHWGTDKYGNRVETGSYLMRNMDEGDAAGVWRNASSGVGFDIDVIADAYANSLWGNRNQRAEAAYDQWWEKASTYGIRTNSVYDLSVNGEPIGTYNSIQEAFGAGDSELERQAKEDAYHIKLPEVVISSMKDVINFHSIVQFSLNNLDNIFNYYGGNLTGFTSGELLDLYHNGGNSTSPGSWILNNIHWNKEETWFGGTSNGNRYYADGTYAGPAPITGTPLVPAFSGLNSLNVIKGFTQHGLNQAISRGFTTSNVLNIVRNGEAIPALGRYGMQMRYTLDGAVVVLNGNGKVVTVFMKTPH